MNINRLALDPPNLPKILYKYRDFDINFHTDGLNRSEIYIPSPNEFNDPFDCKVPFRYEDKELTQENIYLKLLEVSKFANPEKKESWHQNAAYNAQKSENLLDDGRINVFDCEYYKSICDNYGLFCLTPDPANLLMWSYYSKSHQGFTVGYDTDILLETDLFKMGGPINYTEKFNKMPLFRGVNGSEFISIFFDKWNIWSHEQEYRLLHHFKNGKVHKLPKEAVSEIILGCNISNQKKYLILMDLIQKFPHAKIFETSLSKYEFKLEVNPLIDSRFVLPST